ncbi:MAG: hypothetical protein WC405_17730, partial [Syntrophales bacterium]
DNVGIGTTSATSKLQVNGDLKINHTYTAPDDLGLVVNSDYYRIARFAYDDGTGPGGMHGSMEVIGGLTLDGSGNDVAPTGSLGLTPGGTLYLKYGSSNFDWGRFIYEDSGAIANISKLNVQSQLKIGNTAGTNEAGAIRYYLGDFEGYDGSQWQSFTSGSGSSDVWTRNAGNVYPTTLSDKVAIGSTEAIESAKLFVKSANSSTSTMPVKILAQGTSSNIYSGIDIVAENAEPRSILRLYSYASNGGDQNGAIDYYAQNTLDASLRIRSQTGAMNLHSQKAMTFSIIDTNYATDLTRQLVLNTNGRVGIGVLVPQAKLDVAGMIKIGTSSEAAAAGMIRFTGSDFQGYTGSTWESFTKGAPSSTQNITAGTGITSDMLTYKITRIQGNGGAVDITANPQIAGGTDGQIIILQGKSDTNTVKFDTGTGLALSGGNSFTMGTGDTLQLMYDSGTSLWYEISRSDN